MKDFIKNIVLFILILLVSSYILDGIITRGLKKSKLPFFNEWNLIYSGKINADLIINGSSKAHYHISPKILDSVLNLNSFNLAIDGHPYIMQNKKYDIYKRYNKLPKTIIQVVSYGTLSSKDKLTNIKQFLPYLNDSIIQNTVSKYKFGFDKVDFYLPLLRYVKYLDLKDFYHSLLYFIDVKQKIINPNYKGYYGEDKQWDNNNFEKFKQENINGMHVELNTDSVELFIQFLEECQTKNIDVILVYPPSFIEFHAFVNNRGDIINFYKSLAKRYSLKFIDYSNSYLNIDKKYFYNTGHLNKKGAEQFSLDLANDLKKVANF